jgi:RNA polymerase sigma-70 factor (ECF subfamily)
LARITVRTARRRLRRRRLRRFFSLEDDQTYTQIADPNVSPEQAAELTRLYAALDGLPVEHRLAWSLRHIEGHALAEVAAMCDCSLATAKRRISLAATDLRKRLDHA